MQRLSRTSRKRVTLPRAMAMSTESASGPAPRSPSPTNIAIGDAVENANQDHSFVLSTPPALSPPISTRDDRMENASQHNSFVVPAPPSPLPANVAIVNPIENMNPDDLSIMLAPSANKAIVDSIKTLNPDSSTVVPARNSRTGPISTTEKASEGDNITMPVATAAAGQETSKMILSQPGRETEASFTLFPKLVPELRNMIWASALFMPFIIELRASRMIPRAVEPIVLMAVCQESREMALKFYDLVKLGPSFPTAPFYFSGENGICLLRDDDLWNSAPPPSSFGDKSHPWNCFREQVTTLAADPTYPAHMEKQLSDMLDTRQARKLARAIAVFPSVKEVIIMRRVNFEGRVAKMVGYLKEAVEAGRESYYFGVSLWSLPHITYVDYNYNEGEDPWFAMRKALLPHSVGETWARGRSSSRSTLAGSQPYRWVPGNFGAFCL
ncbi:hypothetical protein BGZ57DRAFT_304299 [Hyaloscypha finlandica]|nr:hypothetical protein BGZ57DRAFT_304299 [Hyaloscypha finlandica]